MGRNSKTFGKSEERYRPGKREDPGEFPADKGGILVPDLTLTAVLKWPPKRTHGVSYLYSVVKILSDFRTPFVIFTSTRPSKLRPLGSRCDKKRARCRRVWAVWLRGIIGTTGHLLKGQFALNPGFIFLSSKEFSRRICSVIFWGSNCQLVDKKN